MDSNKIGDGHHSQIILTNPKMTVTTVIFILTNPRLHQTFVKNIY